MQKGTSLHIVHTPVIDLTDEALDRCRELSFGDEGYMCDDLERILWTERHSKKYRYSQAILACEDTILGWALVQPVPYSPKYSAQFFVDPLHRRRGIGGRLLREANMYGRGKPYVFKDEENENFFSVFPDLLTL